LRPSRLQTSSQQTFKGYCVMKRMHVHVSVENIDNAIGFYSALFAAKPSVVKNDYVDA
jgi:hypothetical protein